MRIPAHTCALTPTHRFVVFVLNHTRYLLTARGEQGMAYRGVPQEAGGQEGTLYARIPVSAYCIVHSAYLLLCIIIICYYIYYIAYCIRYCILCAHPGAF